MNCGIYKITNHADGKSYIGQSKNLSRRKYGHFSSLDKNKHPNRFVQRAYNKYGKDNFTFSVLIICDEDNLDMYEESIISAYKTNDKRFGYNLRKVAKSNRGMTFDKGIYKSGDKYNQLTLIERGSITSIGTYLWRCRCECGKEIITSVRDVKSGHTKSCGCRGAKASKDAHTTHGKRYTREYSVWCKMKEKCYNPNNPLYNTHGALGIKISDSWQDIANFSKDMGPPPNGMSLYRKDITRNFCKENCEWADRKTINRNRRDTVRVMIKGENVSIAEAEQFLGIYKSSINQRARDKNETYQQAADHFYKRWKDKQ